MSFSPSEKTLGLVITDEGSLARERERCLDDQNQHFLLFVPQRRIGNKLFCSTSSKT